MHKPWWSGAYFSIFLNKPRLQTNKKHRRIVEIPKNTEAKNEMNKWEEMNPIWQDRKDGELRYYIQPMYWNYGFFPRTYESPWETQDVCGDMAIGDDDPIDVMEVSGAVFPVGSIIEVKLLGGLPNVDIDKERKWQICFLLFLGFEFSNASYF